MSYRKSERGFTLVELMTVAAMVSLLSYMAVESAGALRGETSLVAAQRDVVTALYMARSSSIATNSSRSLVVTPPHSLQIQDSGGNVIYSDGMTGYGSNVTFVGGGSGNSPITVTFDARGLLNPATAVTLTANNNFRQSKTVTVSPTGHITSN